MLFFLLNSLNKIHAFYQYSLNAFVTVFSRAIDVAPGKNCTPIKLLHIHEHAVVLHLGSAVFEGLMIAKIVSASKASIAAADSTTAAMLAQLCSAVAVA